MCGCLKHNDASERCTCICPEHENFDMAYELAMTRYDTIRELERELAQVSDLALRRADEISKLRKEMVEARAHTYELAAIEVVQYGAEKGPLWALKNKFRERAEAIRAGKEGDE